MCFRPAILAVFGLQKTQSGNAAKHDNHRDIKYAAYLRPFNAYRIRHEQYSHHVDQHDEVFIPAPFTETIIVICLVEPHLKDNQCREVYRSSAFVTLMTKKFTDYQRFSLL